MASICPVGGSSYGRILSVGCCCESACSLCAHCSGMVDRLAGVDVEVGDATVARVHMVVVVMMCSVALTQVSVHMQVVVGGRP
jgi:hypothetical protein